MQTGNTDFILKNGLDEACFQHDMAYGKSKDLVKRIQSGKVLRDKAFKIAIDPKYDGYQRGLASMVYKILIKNLVELVLIMNQIIDQVKNYTNQFLENLKKEKSIPHLETIFRLLI